MDATQPRVFGKLLKIYRLAAGLTQASLAERARMTAQGIGALERGTRQTPYRETVRLLADALGLTPDERVRLEATVPRGRASSLSSRRWGIVDDTGAIRAVAHGGRSPFPTAIPADPLSPSTSNLPHPLTRFIGRERDIVTVARLLARSRLVTLTGAGGCGKTRLALESGRAVAGRFAQGVCFVELWALADPALVPNAVAVALGLHPVTQQPVLDTLVQRLRSQELLLVLDNCEHLIAACATLAQTLLHGCPDLRILATSRETLGVTGEVTWRVPSLDLPDPERLRDLTAAMLDRFDAVQLFVDRAQAAHPGFELTDANAAPVAQVCLQLDGIPLALELAAARLRVLTVAQIAERLSDRFQVLSEGNRTAPSRHQTLRGMIDWSYDLLSDGERTLFARLAVFAGGFDLEAAEAVCPDRRPSGVLSTLASLVDKSLVLVAERGGRARYRLLETTRAYAVERLSELEAEDVRRRHAAYYLALAEGVGSLTWGATAKAGLDRLEPEEHNLRAGLTWYREHDPEAGLRLAPPVGLLFHFRGYPAEGREWLVTMLARAPGASANRARALLELGNVAVYQGAAAVAKDALVECLPLLREMGNQGKVGEALSLLGEIEVRDGHYREAVTLLEEGLARSRQTGDPESVKEALIHLGQLAIWQDNLARARSLLEEALALARGSNSPIAEDHVLGCLGDLELQGGRLVEAQAALEARLRQSREIGHNRGIGGALVGLGRVARLQHDFPQARAYLDEGLAFAQQIGILDLIGRSLAELGHLARQEADEPAATQCYLAALEPLRASNFHHFTVNCLGNLGVQLVRRGATARGVRLVSGATALDAFFRTALDPDERGACDAVLATARSILGDEVFARTWADGQAMTLEQAISGAVEEGGS